MKKILVVLALAWAWPATADVMLQWDAPVDALLMDTTNTSPDLYTNSMVITNFVIYRAVPPSTNFVFYTNAGLATNITIAVPSNGTSFYATSQNAIEESDPSNIAIYNRPSKPGLLRFVIP